MSNDESLIDPYKVVEKLSQELKENFDTAELMNELLRAGYIMKKNSSIDSITEKGRDYLKSCY